MTLSLENFHKHRCYRAEDDEVNRFNCEGSRRSSKSTLQNSHGNFDFLHYDEKRGPNFQSSEYGMTVIDATAMNLLGLFPVISPPEKVASKNCPHIYLK